MMTNTMTTLPMNFSNRSVEAFKCGSLVLYKGQFCTVLSADIESYAVPMVRVVTPDGLVAILKYSELGR
jgi:hypothetical protein